MKIEHTWVNCFWHGAEDCEGAYWCCFECDHVYRTEKDLRREFRRMAWKIGWKFWLKSFKVHGIDIAFCPLCTHDL